MLGIGSALIGLIRALVPPQAVPEASEEAAGEDRQASDVAQGLRQQQLVEALEAPEQIDETRRVDQLHHVTRAEASLPAGLEYGEAGLLRAIYRDQAMFSSSAYAALEAVKVVTVPLPWEQG